MGSKDKRQRQRANRGAEGRPGAPAGESRQGSRTGAPQAEGAHGRPQPEGLARALAESRRKSLDVIRKQVARRADAEATIAREVATARAAGATWAQLGRALGVSTEGARKRYG